VLASCKPRHRHQELLSFLREIERFFSITRTRRFAVARSTSVKELINKIDSFVRRYDEDCKPFTWTPAADPILERIARLCGRISGTGS